MIRVKAIKYRKGWVISIGIDPTNPYDLPVKIFRDGKVLDPLLYTITEDEITGSTNRVYITEEKYEETIEEIQKFYKKYGEYHGINIKIRLLVSEETSQENGAITVEELKQTPRPRVRKLSIEEMLGQKTPPHRENGRPPTETIVLATVKETGEIPTV